MKTILAHGCYECLYEKERISNHPTGNLLQLTFSADKITTVPIHQIHIVNKKLLFAYYMICWGLILSIIRKFPITDNTECLSSFCHR